MFYKLLKKLQNFRKNKLFKNDKPKGPEGPEEPEGFEQHKCNVFSDKYVLGEKISEGTFGKVYKCFSKKTGNKYAVKIIPTKKLIQNEITILQQVSHNNIIRMIEVFTDEKKTYIITEYCEFSDLFDYVMNLKNLKTLENSEGYEQEICSIVRQILLGVQYLHSKNIVHRDLKLSNILFFDKTYNVKIIDFGLSVICKEPGELLEEEVGSIGFMSPEIIMGSYDKSCDMWSIGCITFILLYGFNPFNPYNSGNKQIVYSNILKGFNSCNSTERRNVGAFFPNTSTTSIIKTSELSKDFIMSLLTSKDIRLNASEALNHPWLKN
jgi:serine/threonine protein kinase